MHCVLRQIIGKCSPLAIRAKYCNFNSEKLKSMFVSSAFSASFYIFSLETTRNIKQNQKRNCIQFCHGNLDIVFIFFAITPLLRGNCDEINQSNIRNSSTYIITVFYDIYVFLFSAWLNLDINIMVT